jgi:hypothetical protein
MSKNLILEVDRIKEMMGIDNFYHLNRTLIVEGRGVFIKNLWREVLELTDNGVLASNKVGNVSQRLTTMLEKHGSSLNVVQRNQKRLAVLRELESTAPKTMDEVLEILEKNFGTLIVNNIEKNISEYVDEVVSRNLRDEVVRDGSELNNLIKRDLEEEINNFTSREDFRVSSYADQIKKLNSFISALKGDYNKVLKFDDTKILDELVEPIQKQASVNVVNLGGKGISDDIDERLQKEMEDPNFKTATSLEKVSKLRALRDTLSTEFTGKLKGSGLADTEINKIIDDIIQKEIKNISETAYKSLNGFRTNIQRFLGGWYDLIERIETRWKTNTEELERQIQDLLATAGGNTGKYGPEFAAQVRNKIAALSGQLDETAGTVKAFWEETEALLKKAYPEDSAELISYIKSNGVNQEDWLKFLFEEVKVGTKSGLPGFFIRNFEVFTGFIKMSKDLFKVGFDKWQEVSFTWLKRFTNILLTGHSRTLQEIIDRFIKDTYVVNVGAIKIGRKKGYNYANVLATYIEFWISSKILIPTLINTLYTIVIGVKMLIYQTDKDEVEKNKGLIKSFVDKAWNDFKENFAIFYMNNEEIKSKLKKYGIDDNTFNIASYRVMEFLDMVLPIEPMITTVLELAVEGFNTDADETLIQNAKNKADEKLQDLKDDHPELVEKIESIKENPRGAAVLVLDADELEDYIKTLPDGEKESFLAIRYEKSLNKKEKEFIMGYVGGGEEATDTWVENPNTGTKVKLNVEDNDAYGTWVDGKGKNRPLKDLYNIIKQSQTKPPSNNQNESYKITKKTLMENNGKKFGEDNFKHWKETFTFKSEDKNNPGQYKEVKLSMEDVMDRINHYRKKYDEDDAFVRAVVDTHDDVVKIMYTKGLADINESATPRGLALVLRTLNESRGEMEIFSVARPANGNWFLVKGDYTQSQLANMDLEKKEPEDKEKKKDVSGSEELKKKEQTAVELLKKNEKEGLNDLPNKVREKLREKLGRGWTTETMPSFLEKFVEKSSINTIFNDKIDIFKLDSNDDTFDAIVDNSSQIFIKRGFCRSLYIASDKANLNEKQQKVVDHILDKCDKKFLGKLGVRNF